MIERLVTAPGFEFWPDDISHASIDLRQIRGRNQVTDAYLLGLARHRSSVLVTFDRALAASDPDHAVLITANP
jgi:predicted nucleic acid-binding protein